VCSAQYGCLLLLLLLLFSEDLIACTQALCLKFVDLKSFMAPRCSHTLTCTQSVFFVSHIWACLGSISLRIPMQVGLVSLQFPTATDNSLNGTHDILHFAKTIPEKRLRVFTGPVIIFHFTVKGYRRWCCSHLTSLRM
jgi:hypothetical protein